MSASDWDEVKRLAADFQRAQLSSTVQRLSERNCIEIVQKLTTLGLIDVIYTNDGKEYLTPQELSKEIREELLVHGGRINLVELQQILGVDFSHVESKVNEICKNDRSLTLVLGQLIDKSYQDRLAEEINDRLQEQGQLTIAELTKMYDLPADFLSQLISERLGGSIQGHVDEHDRNVLFTPAFVARHKARVRGAFSAVTRPTQLSSIMQQFELQEKLFYSILEELISLGRLAGCIAGGRQEKASYIPEIYTQSQNEWVDSFYKQNGYLEYDGLARLGISDAKSFIKKRYKSENLIYLSTCCVGRAIQDQLEASVDEALTSVGWADVMPSLPSILSTGDAGQLLQQCLKKHPGASVYCDSIIVSDSFISSCSKPFQPLLNAKAEKDVRTNPSMFAPPTDQKARASNMDDSKEDRKDQRKKKAAGASKSGGGLQGREVKMKSVKKKYGKNQANRDEDSDDSDSGSTNKTSNKERIEFMSTNEIEDVLRDVMKECPEELLAEIAQQLYRPLSKQYQELAKSIFLQTMGTATSSARKKTHSDLQDKVNGLWNNARMFEKGLKLFNEETQSHLVKHLLKTVCTDITNLIFNAIATEHMMSVQEDTQITAEMRLKMLTSIPDPTRSVLAKLNSSLSVKNLEDFFTNLEKICGTGSLEVVLKKTDKKKERNLVFGHRQALAEELRNETEAAMVLHLASVLIFQIQTGCMLHAPGRCVPQIIAFLADKMTKDHHEVLTVTQDLVIKQLKKHSSEEAGDNNDTENIAQQLFDLVSKVKDIALSAKKTTPQED